MVGEELFQCKNDMGKESLVISRAMFLAPKVKFMKILNQKTGKSGYEFNYKGIPKTFWSKHDAEEIFNKLEQTQLEEIVKKSNDQTNKKRKIVKKSDDQDKPENGDAKKSND